MTTHASSTSIPISSKQSKSTGSKDAPTRGAQTQSAETGRTQSAAKRTATTATRSIPIRMPVPHSDSAIPQNNAPAPQSSRSSGGKNLIETARGNGSFRNFTKAVYIAGMTDTLSGKGPFTVFAPTDAAFNQLPAGRLDALFEPENRSELNALLNYHVVMGRKSAHEVGKWASAKTVHGQAAPITLVGKSFSIDGSNAVTTDISASNGVIHAIDKVNMPTLKG